MTEARKTTSTLVTRPLPRVRRTMSPAGSNETATTIHLFSLG